MNVLILPADGLTPWVPRSTPPLRKGIFQVRDAERNSDAMWFSLWDGVRWHGAWRSPDEAFERRHFPTAGSVFGEWEWRGFVSNPLAEPTGARVTLPEIFIAMSPY